MVNELARGIETLAAMTEKAGSIGLRVKVEKECSVDNSQASMENIETVLELNCVWKDKTKKQMLCLHRQMCSSLVVV